MTVNMTLTGLAYVYMRHHAVDCRCQHDCNVSEAVPVRHIAPHKLHQPHLCVLLEFLYLQANWSPTRLAAVHGIYRIVPEYLS
jgi:hypothetical protein